MPFLGEKVIKNKKNVSIAILAVAIIAVVIIGAVSFFAKKEKSADGTVPIRISSSTTPSNFELAQKLTGRDIPKEEGITLEPITIQGGEGGTVTMQALLANQLDLSGGSISIWVNAISKGAKVKLVSPQNTTELPQYSGLLVLENSGIQSIKDLAGKKIAVNVLGAEAEFIMKKFLKQNGLSINQVELIVVPAGNQEQALRSKQVDAAAWTTSGGTPFDHAVEVGGVRKIPGTSSYETRGNQSMVNTAEGFKEEFILKHPETVQAYVKASNSAQHIVWEEYKKDPERVRKAYAEIAQEKGGNPQLAKYYRGPRWSPENQWINDKDILFWIDNFVEAGTLKEGQIKPSDIYTNEFNPAYKK